MIVEWLLSVAAGLWEWIATLLPDWELPAELADPNGWLAQVFALAQGIEPFAYWGLIGTLAAIPLAVYVSGLLWKAFRTGFSHFALFGGSG